MSPESQLVVACRGEQHAVEGVLELDRSDHVPSRSARARSRSSDAMRRSPAVLRAGTPGRVPGACSAAITGMACATRSARIGANRRDAAVAVRDALRRPLGSRTLERLACWHAADVQLRRHLAVADPGAGASVPVTIACTKTP
jgi:hypothetical protein